MPRGPADPSYWGQSYFSREPFTEAGATASEDPGQSSRIYVPNAALFGAPANLWDGILVCERRTFVEVSDTFEPPAVTPRKAHSDPTSSSTSRSSSSSSTQRKLELQPRGTHESDISRSIPADHRQVQRILENNVGQGSAFQLLPSSRLREAEDASTEAGAPAASAASPASPASESSQEPVPVPVKKGRGPCRPATLQDWKSGEPNLRILLHSARQMTEEEVAAHIPKDLAGNPTSVGSKLHRRNGKRCKPCVHFVPGVPGSCERGVRCRFCHFPHGKPSQPETGETEFGS